MDAKLKVQPIEFDSFEMANCAHLHILFIDEFFFVERQFVWSVASDEIMIMATRGWSNNAENYLRVI